MQHELLNVVLLLTPREPREIKFKLIGGFLLPSICFSKVLSAVKWQTVQKFSAEILYTAKVRACRIWQLSQSGYDTPSKSFALTAFCFFLPAYI